MVLFLFLWKSILYNNTNTLINIHAWCMYIDKGTRISQWELVSFVKILSEKNPQKLPMYFFYFYQQTKQTYTKVIEKYWIHVQHNYMYIYKGYQKELNTCTT